MTIATIRARGAALVRELRNGYPFWMFLAGIGLAGAVAWWRGRDGALADGIRYAGTLLTVGGLLLVAYGLDKTRSAFGGPTLTSRTVAWGKRIVASVWPRDVVIAVGPAHLAAVSHSATRVEATLSDASIEGRVARLEQQMRHVRQQADADRDALRGEIAAARTNLESQTARITEHMSGLEGRLDALVVGGLVLEWVGLWWLLLGTLAANISGDLAELWARVA